MAADNNIEIYTIGYEIASGSRADMMLQQCATSADNYFLVEGLEIETAFEEIADSLTAARLTQ